MARYANERVIANERNREMRLTLETVRNVLSEVLGYQTFTAGFIKKVVEAKDCPTACINQEGTLGYNSEFVSKYVGCKEDLFSLIFHELLHPMFQHFIFDNGQLENIAADSVINACISDLYWQWSKRGNLFKKLYRDKGIESILRPGCQLYYSKYEKLYNCLYHRGFTKQLSTGEVIQTLKILVDRKEVGQVILLGSHGKNADAGKTPADILPKNIVAKIAADISSSLQNANLSGYSQVLMDLLKESLKTKMSIRKSLLADYATRRKIDNFREYFKRPQNRISPIPIYPSKRDLVLLACNIWPGYFRNKIQQDHVETKGIAIYLDVSGSVNKYLPEILGILNHLKNDIRSIYQFSNIVAETDFKILMVGKIKTSYGTDLDCVAGSVIKNNYDKLIVITDGFASMKPDNQQELLKRKVKMLTILYGGGHSCDDLKQFGPQMELSDVTV
jgi:hypothetical protein